MTDYIIILARKLGWIAKGAVDENHHAEPSFFDVRKMGPYSAVPIDIAASLQ
jgi:hypothetical protein